MVYYKKTRKTTTWRRPRRTTFSRYATYRNRSSASQARQIYLLNKKVNRIQKLNKPEIKLAHYNASDALNFTDELRENVYPILRNGDSPLSSVIDGKFARLNSITFTMSFRYDDASIIVRSETARRLPQPVYLRMLFVQMKASRQSSVDAGDLFDTTSGFTRTRGPLADGASRIVKVLSDKKFMINYNRQTVNKVIRFKYLRNYYKPATEALAKGDVFVYVQCWNPNSPVDDASNVVLTMNSKLAYTDA